MPSSTARELIAPRLRIPRSQVMALQELVGQHSLSLNEVFGAEFCREAGLGDEGISAFLSKSPVKFESLSMISEDERKRIDGFISSQTSYDSWSSLVTSATSDWALRRVQQELSKLRNVKYRISIDGNSTRHSTNKNPISPFDTDSISSQESQVEIEDHIVASTLIDLPTWVGEWASQHGLSFRFRDWSASQVFELRRVWKETYEKYPRYFPKELARSPLWDVTEVVGDSLWYFDQKFYLHELSSQPLQILKAASGGATYERSRPSNEDAWTTHDLSVFAWSLGTNLLVAGTATVLIAGVGAISAPIAITAAGGLIVYGLSTAAVERISKGQTTVQIVGGTISDTVGLSEIWELVTDQDIATGDKLNLTRDQRTEKFAGIAANVLVTPASPKLLSVGERVGSKAQPRVNKLLSDADQAIYSAARVTAAEIAKLPRLIKREAGYLLIAAENTPALKGSNSTAYVGFFIPIDVIHDFIVMYNRARRGLLPSREDIRSLAFKADREREILDSELDLAEQIFREAPVGKEKMSEIEDLHLDDFEIEDDIVDLSELTEKPKRGGETDAARMGRQVHKDQAELRREEGGYASVDEKLRYDNGKAIEVPHLGHRIPLSSRTKIGMTTVRPDAIDFINKRVIDDKPDDGDMHLGQMSEYIAAYLEKYNELPNEVVIKRYGSKGEFLRYDIYSPADYGFFRPYIPPRLK